MTRRSRLSPSDIAVAAGVGAVAALGLGALLASLSTPRDFQSRIGALQQTAERAEALLRPVRDRGPFGVEALCTRDPGQQADRLRELVSARAAAAGLSVDSLEARAEPAPEVSEQVTPVRLRFTVTGSYDGVVGLAALLSRERPQVFVESLDLVPKVSNATLSLSGRAFCGA